MNLWERIKEQNAKRKVSMVKPFLKGHEAVLDFGCGDLLFAEKLLGEVPSLSITGVEVRDYGRQSKTIPFVYYDGTTLPFRNGSFSTVIAYHVFHHCNDLDQAVSECFRVARRRLIVVEPTCRYRFEIPFMKVADICLNEWKRQDVGHVREYLLVKEWTARFRRFGGKVELVRDVEVFPPWLPLGRSHLFVVSLTRD